MSGRHRKQSSSSATKTFTKVAITSAFIGGGMALVGTGNADAATDAQWDAVAQCESGGNWAINTGNGFHGGLQFHPQTWSGHGGGEFAPTANQASREQQIVVGERVLASQGKGAWPTCGGPLSHHTPRTAPADAAPVPDLSEGGNGSLGSSPEAATSADVIEQIDEIIGNSAVSPEIASLWEAAKDSGFALTPDQVNLYNQNKDLLPLP